MYSERLLIADDANETSIAVIAGSLTAAAAVVLLLIIGVVVILFALCYQNHARKRKSGECSTLFGHLQNTLCIHTHTHTHICFGVHAHMYMYACIGMRQIHQIL